MKKIVFLIAICGAFLTMSAQSHQPAADSDKDNGGKKQKVEVIRDRLNFDIFHTFWMGTPAQGNFKKFNPGFNVAAMWDFKIPQTPVLSFGLGLGFTYYTQYSNCIMKYDRENDLNKYFIIPENIEYKYSRMSYMNCHIPFEIRYRHSCGFKLSVGIHVGLVAGFAHRYKGDNYNGVEDEYLNYKNRDFYNKQKFSADVYLRMGWKAIGVFYSYQLNQVFDAGKGPKLNPMSLGISVSLF